jgi:GT2 family glycosyltransferase
LLKISLVIPTRDRPDDLAGLLTSVAAQDFNPFEIIIVDDSPSRSASQVIKNFTPTFDLMNCKFKYIKGTSDGLPSARNLGIAFSEGDAILFLDDDTLLHTNVINSIVNFFAIHPVALGVQPEIVSSTAKNNNELSIFKTAFHKAMMLGYYDLDKMFVRKSGASVLPKKVTKVIHAERLSGCCCYRQSVFRDQKFDTKLKLWGYMEDLDFSHRLYQKNPQSLYVIPSSKIIHKTSKKARLPNRTSIYMTTIYWFYVFFKDIFDNSVLNLIALFWGLIGNLVVTTSELIINQKPRREWWSLIYLLKSYATAFRNLKSILMLQLDFFN